VTQIVCAVYWFHPLVWFAAYKIWVERESACDDTVVLRGEKPSVYADLLLELANGFKGQKPGLLGCTVAITRKNRVGKRIQAILNPTIARTPLGKIGIALLLGVAVGVITLTATISPFAKTEPPDVDTTLSKIAMSDDVPKITFKGKVLKPDGTPADRVYVTFLAVARGRSHGSTHGTDKEGHFEFDESIPAGMNVMIYANSMDFPRRLISEPVVFLSDKDRDDITIQLQEGILMGGTAMYDDGTPASGANVTGFRPITPLVDVDDVNTRNNFVVEFRALVMFDGSFMLYLPPAKWQIGQYGNERSGSIPIWIREGGKGYYVDLVWPAPLRGKVVTENGTTPRNIRLTYASKFKEQTSCSSLTMETPGEFLFNKKSGSWFIAMTEDGSLGAIHPITDDKLGEFQTVVLRPTATVWLLLQNSSGDPIAGQQVTVSTGAKLERSTSTTSSLISPATTDSSGFATFHFPPGTGYYKFTWDEGEMEIEKTFQPGETILLRPN